MTIDNHNTVFIFLIKKLINMWQIQVTDDKLNNEALLSCYWYIMINPLRTTIKYLRTQTKIMIYIHSVIFIFSKFFSW